MYKNRLPGWRKRYDPFSYAPYSNDGVEQRIQCELCLNDSDVCWFAYEGGHKKYDEIGEKMGWPGSKYGVVFLDENMLRGLGLKRIEIPSKCGRMILWNCGIPHGLTKAYNTTPRLAMTINYQCDKENEVGEKRISLL